MAEIIKIGICDDMPQIREYLLRTIEKEADMVSVGTAANGEGGVALAMEHRPDIMLMDIQMDYNEDGIAATEAIKSALLHTKVIIVTVHDEDALLFKAYGAGADDYLVKTAKPAEIVESIRNVHHNKFLLRPDTVAKIKGEFVKLQRQQKGLTFLVTLLTKLTNAEFEILQALCNGCTRREIARQRYVELVTINTQITKILKKLEYKRVSDLVKTLKQLEIFRLME